jgi:hypothetical protein
MANLLLILKGLLCDPATADALGTDFDFVAVGTPDPIRLDPIQSAREDQAIRRIRQGEELHRLPYKETTAMPLDELDRDSVGPGFVSTAKAHEAAGSGRLDVILAST